MRTAARRARTLAAATTPIPVPPRPRSTFGPSAARWASSAALPTDDNGAGPSRIRDVDWASTSGDLPPGPMRRRSKARAREPPQLASSLSADPVASSSTGTEPTNTPRRPPPPTIVPSNISAPPSYFSSRNTTSSSHSYPLRSAYGRIGALPRSTDAEHALDLLPSRSAPTPPYVLSLILCMRLSVPALGRILPMLLDKPEKKDSLTQTRARLDALAAFLGHCTRLKAYIFIAPAVDAAIEGMSVLEAAERSRERKARADGQTEASPESLAKNAASALARYHRLLTCLIDPEWKTHAYAPEVPKPGIGHLRLGTSLSPPVQASVARIVQHTLSVLESLPAPLSSRTSTLSAFFGALLTADTLRPLMQHVRKHHVHLSEADWRHAAVVAFEAGAVDESMNRRGREYLAQAARVCAAELKKGTADPERAESREDTYRIMATVASPSFAEALESLQPLIKRLHTGNKSSSAVKMTTTEAVESNVPETAATETITTTATATITESDQVLTTPTPTHEDAALPHRSHASGVKLSHLWSILLTRASADPTVSDNALFQLVAQVPEDAVCAATVTAAVRGLTQRHDSERAVQIWNVAKERYAQARSSAGGHRYDLFDAALLSVAADAVARNANTQGMSAIGAAIKVVDYYGARPGVRSKSGIQHSVPLDTRALNALLRICVWESSPSVAFRLFRIAEARWGVRPDATSLAIVLNTARHHTVQEQDTLASRLQLMKDTFSLRTWSARSTSSADADGYFLDKARSSETRALLDPPHYTWRAEYGPRSPVDVAKALFEGVLFANWPTLDRTPSPLRHGGALTELRALISPPRVAGPPPVPPPSSTPSPFAHIVPDARAWDAYVKIIAYHFPEDDLPLRLAYMRALNIQPLWRTMLIALKMVGEREGPRMRVTTSKGTGLIRDEHAVRAYLEDWLGTEVDGEPRSRKVPSEDDVAAFWKDQEIRRAQVVAERKMQERSE